MDDTQRIEKSLEKLHDKIDDNTKTLIVNTQDLKHHILRTDLLQLQVAETEAKVEEIEISIIKFVSPFIIIRKIVVVAALVAGLAVTLMKLYG